MAISNDPNLNDNFSVVSSTKIMFKRDDTLGKNIAGDGIYLYDINSKSLTQLRSGTEDVYDAAIDGSLVAWQRNFNQTSNADGLFCKL